jgi:hypothetical protein
MPMPPVWMMACFAPMVRTNRPGWINAGTAWSSLSGPLSGPSAYVAQRQVSAVVQLDNEF